VPTREEICSRLQDRWAYPRGHSFKLAAALQAAQTASALILLRMYSAAGHSHRGKPTAAAMAAGADRLAFLDGTLGMAAIRQ
jgi:prolyl oligopeptidase